MRKVICMLAAGIAITAVGCSTGCGHVNSANRTWVNEQGWVCDGESCRVPKAIQSRQNG